MDLKNAPFSLALERLLRYSENSSLKPIGFMTYRRQEGVYVFSQGEGGENECVTFHFHDADLVSALRQVCAQVKLSYALNPGIYAKRHITLSARNIPFAQAVERILETAHARPALKCAIKSGIVIVGRLDSYDRFTEDWPHRPSRRDRVVVSLQHENLYQAMWAVLFSTGEAFILNPVARSAGVESLTQTASVEQIVKELMRNSKVPLKFTIEDEIVSVTEKYPSKEGHY